MTSQPDYTNRAAQMSPEALALHDYNNIFGAVLGSLTLALQRSTEERQQKLINNALSGVQDLQKRVTEPLAAIVASQKDK